MNFKEAMVARHSVRQYKKQALTANVLAALPAEIDACNRVGGLHIQLVTDEPKAFDGFMAHYGKFSGVTNLMMRRSLFRLYVYTYSNSLAQMARL